MSVVPMKMLTVTGPAASIDQVICTCLVNEQFHPVEASRVTKHDRLAPFEWTNPWQEPLAAAEKLLSALGLSPELRDFREENPSMSQVQELFRETEETLSSLQSRQTALEAQIACNTRDVGDLEKFRQLPGNLEDIYHLSYVSLRFGRMPRESYDSLSIKVQRMDELLLCPTQLGKDFVYLAYASPKRFASKSDNLMASLGFERIELTPRALGTPEQTAQMLEADNQGCRRELEQLKAEKAQWIAQRGQRLLVAYSYVRFMYQAGQIRKMAVRTEDSSFLLCGWVPEQALPRIKERFTGFPEVLLAEDKPRAVKGAAPPVLLKNNLWGRLFQPFTEMYGLPAYNEFDPTFLMAVTYSVLFGIMYGDVGQGLVLIALGVFLLRRKGMWLGGILASVGVFSTLFGFVFGSFFGCETLIPGFHVLESGDNATRILLASAALGVVLIVATMGINIVNGIRQRDIKKIFFTNNSLAGLVFYLAVVIGAVVTLTTGARVFSGVYVVFLILVPILIMFLQEPLGKLAAHQKDWKPESIGGFVAENFFEMFEVLLSFVTNTVSFLRVGAYAICHAGMMLVVYTLAGEPASPVVLVIGNILVMGIEGLMVCIQVLRLEFYEMFGRFYQSGGKPFTPSMVETGKKINL